VILHGKDSPSLGEVKSDFWPKIARFQDFLFKSPDIYDKFQLVAKNIELPLFPLTFISSIRSDLVS
jgi:hypothetical protein